jgi:hypothetical protein
VQRRITKKGGIYRRRYRRSGVSHLFPKNCCAWRCHRSRATSHIQGLSSQGRPSATQDSLHWPTHEPPTWKPLAVGIVASHTLLLFSGYYIVRSSLLLQFSLWGLVISSIWLVTEQRQCAKCFDQAFCCSSRCGDW